MVDDLINAGRYDEARAQILSGASGNADALSVLREIREWLRGKEYDQVQKALARDGDMLAPFIEPAQIRLALEAFESGDPTQIEPFLESPHLGAEAWCALGLTRIRQGNHDGAKAAFEEALRRDPGHYRAKTNLGNLALEAGQTDEAIRIYQEALQQNPEFGLAHHNLGAAYRKKGQLDKSVYHIRRGQRLQMKAPSRPSSAMPAASSMPSRPPIMGSLGRWWIWLIVIGVLYLVFKR